MTGHQATAAAWRVSVADDTLVAALQDSLGVSRVVARLLVTRGVTRAEAAKRFLEPSLERDWRDPETLPGMTAVADAVAGSVSAGARITVFGDFDADGLAGAAVACRGLAALGADVTPVVPHRFRDGYGLTAQVIPRVLETEPDLVVTVDCGISAGAEVVTLLEAGIDVVVTDHHEPGESMPEAVPLCDPKLDDSYPFRGLAGAGVALKMVQAVGTRLGRPDAHLDLTDIAAIGTIGDIVPLLDENRSLVAHGLDRMRRDPRPGIAALAAVAGVAREALRSQSVAFALAPRLNAAGRLADPAIALGLLMTDDADEATVIAKELDELNRLRQSAEQDLFEAALVQAEPQAAEGAHALVVAGEGWHEGVRGIVASRLARRFDVPALVFSVEDGEAAGSGRSVPGLDLHAVLAGLPESLTRFGGHAMAVGLTLDADRLAPLRTDLLAAVSGVERDEADPEVDDELSLEEIGPELAAEIDLLEPFGQDNRRPLFGTRGVFMHERRRVGRNADHLLFDAYDGIASVPAVAFRCPDVEEAAAHEAAADVAYEVEQDEWRGRSRTRMLVRRLLRHTEDPDAPAATLVEELFDAAPAILAREEYAGIGDAESFHTKLAGVTFEGRQQVVGELSSGTPLRLVRQPDNPYDANACALLEPNGRQVGFFNRRLASVLAPLLDGGLALDVEVTEVTGGEDDRSLGVNVLVERRGGRSDVPDLEDASATRRRMAGLSPEDLDSELTRAFIGDGTLHDAQRGALAGLAAGKDTLCVMATGRGKSLVFHMHAARIAISEGSASVFVYPLRALVSDQAFHLGESLGGLGVRPVVLTGETAQGARDEAFAGLADGSIDAVLTTPEFLERHSARFEEAGRVGFLVVDEAHHVGSSRTGHRPAYGRLGKVVERLGRPRVLAVTATAGDEVADVIVETLGTAHVVCDSTVRGNLRVRDRRGGKDKLAHVSSLAARGDKTVVYVNSRETSVRIASQLRRKVPSLRHRVAFYNGGLTKVARHAVERAFRDGDLTTVVATSAFGEGVNIPDIRHVVHYHLPFSDVDFNQMSGRAGRDGARATVHLLYGPRDSQLNELILESLAPERDDLAQLYLVLRGMAEEEPDGFEVTNAELAHDVGERRRGSTMSDRGVSSALGVFRELGLLEGEGGGAYRKLRVCPQPQEKVDLGSSLRYAEGVRERETFRAFRDWALGADAEELLVRFNRPILPTRYA